MTKLGIELAMLIMQSIEPTTKNTTPALLGQQRPGLYSDVLILTCVIISIEGVSVAPFPQRTVMEQQWPRADILRGTLPPLKLRGIQPGNMEVTLCHRC